MERKARRTAHRNRVHFMSVLFVCVCVFVITDFAFTVATDLEQGKRYKQVCYSEDNQNKNTAFKLNKWSNC